MATTLSRPEPNNSSIKPVLFSVLLLAAAYALLGLSLTERPSHMALMQRCVLMSGNLSRIWSVANVEVGLAYFGVFFGMAYYVLATREARDQHLRDLAYALAYVFGSFAIDSYCVARFSPFVALLIGDAVVMTFAFIVSRRMWFQRLLGVFVPLIFLTCGFGHLLEGMSFWKLTYPVNVPWSMVTGDIGFAVLVNSSRFPGFIRGQDIQAELAASRLDQARQSAFFSNVLHAVTDGKLRYHPSGIPLVLGDGDKKASMPISRANLAEARDAVHRVATEQRYPQSRIDDMLTSGGEAMMNAVTHGENGTLDIVARDSFLQLWVRDRGKGIPIDDIPNATLRSGWSSRGTLGAGFTLIMGLVDELDLATGNDGTLLVLTFSRDLSPSK